MSLRIRLSLLFSTILVVTMLVFGAAVYAYVEHTTRVTLESELADEARLLLASNTRLQQITNVTNVTDVEDVPVESNSLITRIEEFSERCSLTNILHRLRGMMSSGRVLPLSDAGLTALQQGQPWSEISTVDVAQGAHLVYSQPIVRNSHLVGVAQVAKPYTDQQNMLATLRDVLLMGGGAGAVLVFGLTFGLSGFALRPMTKLASAARDIANRHDFRSRLAAPDRNDPNDDVGQLAHSLNSMLDRLQMTQQATESQLAAQRDFVADVSHELRTPLTTMRGNLGLLQRVPVDKMDEEERKAVLGDAVEEVERMSRLVNELLLLARTNGTAQQPVRLHPVALTSLVEAMCRKAMALAHGRLVHCDLQPNVIVTGNADALNQVLLILLDNAIKFTRTGGHITLQLRADGTLAHLTVHDTGVGIASDALPNIFNRFYRGDNRRAGHGLGLAIAKQLTESQGGIIAVHSEAGQGSAFTVSLPLA